MAKTKTKGPVNIYERRAHNGHGDVLANCPATRFFRTRKEAQVLFEYNGDVRHNLVPIYTRISATRAKQSWDEVCREQFDNSVRARRLPAAISHYSLKYSRIYDAYKKSVFSIHDMSARKPYLQTWRERVAEEVISPLVLAYRDILCGMMASTAKLLLDEALTHKEVFEDAKDLLTTYWVAREGTAGIDLTSTPDSIVRSFDNHGFERALFTTDVKIAYIEDIGCQEEALAYIEFANNYRRNREEMRPNTGKGGMFMDSNEVDELFAKSWPRVSCDMYGADWEMIDLTPIVVEVPQCFPVSDYFDARMSEDAREHIYPLCKAGQDFSQEFDVSTVELDGRTMCVLELVPQYEDKACEGYDRIIEVIADDPNKLWEWVQLGTILHFHPYDPHHRTDNGYGYSCSTDGYFRWCGPGLNTEDWHKLMRKIYPDYEPEETVPGFGKPSKNQKSVKWENE